jgi:two-component system chemotaxis response regulator CheB
MPLEPRTRVLVVDDSAFARKVLREALSSSSDIEVVGIARDGLEALELIAELKPDVVTLDLVMPNLDGLGVLRALRGREGPRVVVVSISGSDSELGAEALQIGAVGLVHKTTALATQQLYELSAELVAKVRAAAVSRNREYAPSDEATPEPPPLVRAERGVRLVVIGASTGGPQAITRLLGALPAELPCAVALALHIPAGYTEALARRLDERCALTVFEAAHGRELRPGTVAIAPGGLHLRVRARGTGLITEVDTHPRTAPFCPSVDALFQSAAELGAGVLGVVLTGMGNDGVQGAGLIRSAGGRILTESESSCIVYGMPRATKEAGHSDAEAPIERMAATILRHIG